MSCGFNDSKLHDVCSKKKYEGLRMKRVKIKTFYETRHEIFCCIS